MSLIERKGLDLKIQITIKQLLQIYWFKKISKQNCVKKDVKLEFLTEKVKFIACKMLKTYEGCILKSYFLKLSI